MCFAFGRVTCILSVLIFAATIAHELLIYKVIYQTNYAIILHFLQRICALYIFDLVASEQSFILRLIFLILRLLFFPMVRKTTQLKVFGRSPQKLIGCLPKRKTPLDILFRSCTYL